MPLTAPSPATGPPWVRDPAAGMGGHTGAVQEEGDNLQPVDWAMFQTF